MFDFKGFISALLNKNNDSSISNLKSATILVRELPESDIHKALQEIVKALTGLNTNTRTPLKERIRVLLYLDEKAFTLQQTLCKEFLSALDAPETMPHGLLPTILQFWEEMDTAYQLCIRLYAENPGNAKIQEQMPLLTAKGLHYLAMRTKWQHICYQPVERQTWRHLHRLYLFAERENFDKTQVKLYANRSETTCASEYMQAMLLHLANPAGLLPAQIEMVDAWLDSWAQSVNIEKDFRPQRQLYAVNLGDAKPARKQRRNMQGEKYRYWGIGLLRINITKTIERLQHNKRLKHLKPDDAALEPEHIDLIEKVSDRWAGQNTSRVHERVTAEKPLQVSKHFANIVTCMKSSKKTAGSISCNMENSIMTDRESIEKAGEELASNTHHWWLENESLNGYGITFAHHSKTDPLRIGTLVGLKDTAGKSCCIGIVRRIHHETPRKVQAGIQALSKSPVLVKLHPPQGESGPTAHGIYLPEYFKHQQGHRLLMPREGYAQGKMMQFKAQGKTYAIRLQKAEEHGSDYIQTGFDVVAKV